MKYVFVFSNGNRPLRNGEWLIVKCSQIISYPSNDYNQFKCIDSTLIDSSNSSRDIYENHIFNNIVWNVIEYNSLDGLLSKHLMEML